MGTTEGLNKVYFMDDNTGFIIGDNGTLFRTSDGGENWTNIPIGVSHDLLAISFANQEVGYINGLKTTDGGNSWSIESVTLNFGLIKAFDEENLIGGDGLSFHGEVYKSYDAGSTWETTADPIETGFYTDEYFINDEVGYMTSWYSGNLIKTTDGGENWASVGPIIDVVSNGIYGVTFPSSNIGVVAGSSHIAKTTDGGETWASIYSIIDGEELFYTRGVFATSESNYIVVGGDYTNATETIYETTDGGSTWIFSNSSVNGLEDVTCTSNNCYAVGQNGTLLTKSNNLVSTNEHSQDLIAINLYPNPATNYLQVESNNLAIEGVEIIDIYGSVYAKQSLTGSSVFVGDLPKGFYLLKVKFEGREKVMKFEKM